MSEVKVFLTALQFYTRIPCASWVDFSTDNLTKATRYLPVIGWLVGSFSALILFISLFLFEHEVAIVFSMGAGVLLTGAFHEDGFADVCDGFGGGWTREKILEIMKDSRVGAYGVIGIVLLLLLKYTAIQQLLPNLCYVSLIAAHALSRLAAVAVIRFSTYTRDEESAKAKFTAEKINNTNFIWSIIFGLLPLFLFNNLYIFIILFPLFLVQYFMNRYFKKWIGGYTGDCLGATQQVSEVVCYLSIYIVDMNFKTITLF